MRCNSAHLKAFQLIIKNLSWIERLRNAIILHFVHECDNVVHIVFIQMIWCRVSRSSIIEVKEQIMVFFLLPSHKLPYKRSHSEFHSFSRISYILFRCHRQSSILLILLFEILQNIIAFNSSRILCSKYKASMLTVNTNDKFARKMTNLKIFLTVFFLYM